MPPTDRRRSEDMDEPVSLAPLDPEEALRALLAVRPDSESDKAASTAEEKSSE